MKSFIFLNLEDEISFNLSWAEMHNHNENSAQQCDTTSTEHMDTA